MPVMPDATISSASRISECYPATLPPLSEGERVIWRLILHTLRVRRCVAFVKGEGDRWMAVEAYSIASPSKRECDTRLSLRYLEAFEVQELRSLAEQLGEEDNLGVGSDELTVLLPSATRICGFLRVAGRMIDAPFSDHDRITLQLFRHHVITALQNILTTSRDDYSPANVDYLTDLYNYRYFRQRLTREVLRAELSGDTLSLLMIDLVHYKQINDTYGHEVGNMVLAQIASLLRRAVRETDVVCRYGGDEFVVILPHADREQALAAAHRLEGILRASQVNVPDVGPISTPQLSIGLSTFPSLATSPEELIRQADSAQYEAKALSPPAICSFEKTSPPSTP